MHITKRHTKHHIYYTTFTLVLYSDQQQAYPSNTKMNQRRHLYSCICDNYILNASNAPHAGSDTHSMIVDRLIFIHRIGNVV